MTFHLIAFNFTLIEILAGNDWRYISESTLRRVNSEVLSVFVEDLIPILTAFQI